MKISFSPIRSDDRLELAREGDAIIINGESFDFSPIPEGGTLPRSAVDCAFLASDITREAGGLSFSILLPVSADAPEHARFPSSVSVRSDGPIKLPTEIEVSV